MSAPALAPRLLLSSLSVRLGGLLGDREIRRATRLSRSQWRDLGRAFPRLGSDPGPDAALARRRFGFLVGRALADRDAWITGQRRAHGPERASLAVEEADRERGMAKHNPLALWSDADLQRYVERHDVPVNALHARGYPSIGCWPCTARVAPGEDPRSGRWAGQNKTECGIHS